MSQKQYANHKDVEKKYKWDLSFLLEGKKPEEVLNALIRDFKKEIKVKDSKYDSPELYLKYLKRNDKLSERFFKFSNYISNSTSLNVVDANIIKLSQKFQFEIYKVNQELGSETVRFFKNSSKISKWAKLPSFKEFKNSLERTLEEKKYQLPKAIEEFRIKESRADINATEPFSILTNSELNYGHATSSKGKKIKVTRANIPTLKKHNDASVRKSAVISFGEAFYRHRQLLSNLLYQHKKSESTWAKLKGFKSSIDYLTFDDRVDEEFLVTLFGSVIENKHVLKPFFNYRKKFYKARFGEKMTKYDTERDLVSFKSKVTVEEAIEDVKEAVKPFGKEYNDVVKKCFDENWVDFMPVKNKRGGAYSIGGSYGLDKKLILLNFDGTSRSTETLAHELGHSMHSYFSDKSNNLTNSQYSIFVAEIASIFNELMIYDYWLSKSNNKKEKFMIYENMIKGFIGTVMRQTEWANYEFDFYKELDKGTPLSTYEAISKLYFENSKKYSYKPAKKFVPKEVYQSIYVPHFYYGFYVYKYAIGQLVAAIFFSKYKNEGPAALQEYISKFLSAGSVLTPLETLKQAGVDLHDPSSYKLGFDLIENAVKEYVKLGKEIFKV